MFYSFKETYLDNFFTYSDTIVPLEKQGLVIVKGHFQDQDGANGAGKSLLFSSVPLLLQGQLPTGKIKATESKDISLTTKATVDKDRYSIALANGHYKIKKNSKAVTPYRKPDAVKYLQSIFPDDSLLNSTSFVSQFSPLYITLISGTPALRMKVIESFIDQTKLNALKEKVKGKNKELSSKEEDTLEIKSYITSCKKQLNNLPTKPNKNYKITLSKYKKELYDLQETIAEVTSEFKEYGRYKTAKDRIRTKKSSKAIKLRIIEIEEVLPNLKRGVSDIRECQEELDIYLKLNSKFYTFDTPKGVEGKPALKSVIPEKKALKIIGLFDTYVREMHNTKEAISDLEDLGSTKTCPTCYQTIKKSTLDTTIKTLNEKLKELRNFHKLLLNRLGKIVSWCNVRDTIESVGITNEYINLYKKHGLKHLKNKVSKLESEYNFLKSQLPYVLILETFEVKNPPKNNLENLKNRKATLEGKIETLSEKILYIKTTEKQRKELTSELQIYQNKLSKLSQESIEDKKYLPIILKTLTSREFRTEIIYDFCEALIKEWNLYSSDMFSQKTKFSLGIEQGYPAFLFSYNNSKPYDIKFLSGGEKKRLIMCMIPSILNLSPSPTNILVVDELDANVDEIGTEAMLSFLPNILHSNLGKDSIFFITPRSQITHPDYCTWFVDREGDTSNLNIRG